MFFDLFIFFYYLFNFPGHSEWNLGAQSDENITNLLNKENLTIEDILDEENILSDLKLSPKKFGVLYYLFLISFTILIVSMYSHPKFIKEMISYIIREPDLAQNPKVFQKFPFNSSEIFFLELEDIINAFFVEKIEENLVSDEFVEPKAEENNEMMEKCIGYLSKFDMISSPKKKNLGQAISGSPKIDEDDMMMEKKFSPFKPIDNHFDLFCKTKSNQSIVVSENQTNYDCELLDHLFSFLENSEKKLNLTLAGYFSKVIHALMNKRFMDVSFYIYIYSYLFFI